MLSSRPMALIRFLAQTGLTSALLLFASVPAWSAVPSNDELVSLMTRVVDSHPAVVAARSTLAAAQADLDSSKWARFPGLTVEGFANGLSNGSVSSVVSLEQPIWAAGRIKAAIAQARARVDAGQAGVDEAVLELALRTSAAYIDYLRLQARERIYADGVAEHERLVESIKRRVEQEVSSESDAAYATQRLLSIQQEQIQNRVGAQLALSRLRELSGVDDLTVKAVLRFNAEEHLVRLDGVLRAALDFSPRDRRLQADVDAAAADTAIRKAQIWPQVNLQAAHYAGGNYGGGSDRIGLVLRIQTDGGLSRVAAVRSAAQRENAARAAVDAGVRDIREQVVADLSENSVAASRIDAGARAAVAARTVTESYLRQFTAGRRTWPEVLNVVREGVAARINEVDAQASAIASALRLQLRSGQWRPGEEASSTPARSLP